MKTKIFIVSCLVFYAFSCTRQEQPESQTETGNQIAREYHSNGKIKTESEAKGNLRQGLTRNYDHEGRLISEVTYVDNIRHGRAANYYAKSGKVHSTLHYVKGVKQGDEIWYYESGKTYRVSPFIDGRIDGLQRIYYESGQIMAEVPYKNGYPGKGLKEYNENGTLISEYPELIIVQKDYLMAANKVLLMIYLSAPANDIKFYRDKLIDGRFIHKGMLQMAAEEGTAQMDFNIPPGAMLRQNIEITACFRTKLGNPCVTTRSFSLNVMNSGN